MAGQLYGVKVDDFGNPVLRIHEPDGEARRGFYRLFFETSTGEALSPYVTKESEDRLGRRFKEVILKWYGPTTEEVTLDQFIAVVASLLAVRDPQIVPPEPVVEDEPEDTTPRDKNGQPLSASQLAWREHAEFASRNSVAACRARAQTDPSFRKFMASSYQREMNEKPVDAGIILGQPRQPQKPAVPAALIAFAETYHKTPISEVRRLMSTSNLNHRQYAKNVDDATNAGLI
jgi:hypothetical protein